MDSTGSFDDSSDFPIPAKSAVLFYRPGPRFHARKKIALYISGKVYSVRMREDADQNNSEYGHFSCSVIAITFHFAHVLGFTSVLSTLVNIDDEAFCENR